MMADQKGIGTMTRYEMEEMHRLRRKARKLEICRNIVGGIILTIMIFAFMNMAINTWIDEMDAHGEYNRQYQQQMEMHKYNNQ